MFRRGSGERSYYEILGVSPTASQEEIKKAYHKAALKHHPDRKGDVNMFKKVQEAYGVLSNPQKRALYDKYGRAGIEHYEKGAPSPAAERSGGPPDLFELFGSDFLFRTPKTPDTVVKLKVTLEELYKGKQVDVAYHRTVFHPMTTVCPSCMGRGSTTTFTRGFGGSLRHTTVCHSCFGYGQISNTKIEEQVVQVNIERGTKGGTRYRFEGKGNVSVSTRGTGDLVVVLEQIPHDVFTRVGDDLAMTAEITLYEALTRYAVRVRHLNGSTVVVRGKGVVHPGAKHVVKGLGFRPGGSLVISFSIRFPDTTSDESVLAAALNANPHSDSTVEGDVEAVATPLAPSSKF
eukprot:Sspe_Gene.116166::Locus_104857_Transcript_1_1_Confidence_1.000_Length_1185::g.116166::m.116166